MAKIIFTRAGSSDRNNDFEETVQQIKNRYQIIYSVKRYKI